jgi:hypothetical protein
MNDGKLTAEAQAVIDAAVALCLAEKKVAELTGPRGNYLAYAQHANSLAFGGNDWITGFAEKMFAEQAEAAKHTAMADLFACRSKLASAVRAYQSPPSKV